MEEKFLTIDIETLSQMIESVAKMAYLAGANATSTSDLDDRGRLVIDILKSVYTKTAEQYSEQFEIIEGSDGELADELFKGLLGDGKD